MGFPIVSFAFLMRQIIPVILLSIGLGLCPSAHAQYLTGLTLNHDGESRVYDVYIPVDYSPSERVPLILNMHGFSATSQSQASYSEFNLIADTARFIVVYPQGLVRTIDTGQTGTHWNAYFGTDVDDKGFLVKLMDKMMTDYNIDEARVYATGWSNGGYMAYRLACEESARLAAVASVTGTMVFQQLPNCNPDNPVSVLHIHGTDDKTVNYNGSSRSVGVSEVISTWVNNNNCQIDGVTEISLPDIDQTDNSTVSKFEYNTCSLTTDVHLYKVTGGGHTWPGATIDREELGATNRDIKASAVIWEFFRLHKNVNQVTDTENELKDQIFAYPAIFSENVTVNRLPQGALMSLYSYSGQLILQQKARQSRETLPVRNLNPGVYILHIQLPGKEYTSIRLVKSR